MKNKRNGTAAVKQKLLWNVYNQALAGWVSLKMHSFGLEYSALGTHTSASLLLKVQGMMTPLYFSAENETATYAT